MDKNNASSTSYTQVVCNHNTSITMCRIHLTALYSYPYNGICIHIVNEKESLSSAFDGLTDAEGLPICDLLI